MKTFETLTAAVAAGAGTIGKALLLFVCIILFLQVVLRFGFNAALSWPEEAARYAVIWAVMLYGSVLVRDEQLISVDFFDQLWPRQSLVFRNIAYRTLLAAVLIILLIEGWEQAVAGAPRSTAATELSWFWPYAAIPVGAALMLLQMSFLAVRDLKRGLKKERRE